MNNRCELRKFLQSAAASEASTWQLAVLCDIETPRQLTQTTYEKLLRALQLSGSSGVVRQSGLR